MSSQHRPYLRDGDAAEQPLPAVGQRWTMRPERGTRTVTITRVWDTDTGPAVAYEWRDDQPGQCGSACPLPVFLAAYKPEQPRVQHSGPDTAFCVLCLSGEHERVAEPVTAALATLIPGGDPERMSVVVTETTPDGAEHTWSGSLAGLAERIAPGASDPWAVVARLTAWLDNRNGHVTPAEIALRLLKVQEEAGEVAAAWIGVTGQNPRKGVTHTTGEVLGELCDVIVAAMVAMATLTDDPAPRFARKLAEIAALRLDATGGES